MRRLLLLLVTGAVIAQPRADRPGVEIREVAAIPQVDNQHPVRIDRNPADGTLYVLATVDPSGSGLATSRLYRMRPTASGFLRPVLVLSNAEHGAPHAVGMAFGPDGTLFLVGNENVGSDQTRFIVRRGTASGTTWTDWETVATSAPYLLSRTWFDHRANAIAVSPDGTRLILNSGARTDHGEMYDGVRDEALTALLLQIPTDATDLVLPNDRQSLIDGGYVYAQGIRNTADLAYAPNGDLFGPENAGDRDDSEELNWLRQGEHYGFPWRIGTSVTPMQFEGYDPGTDPFVLRTRNRSNEADTGWYFSNDPDYPAPPDGVTFVDPIPNLGGAADRYRDAQTGEVTDASETNTSLGTFTAHRSPLGMVFDADSLLADGLRGSAFVLSFNGPGDELIDRLGGGGEDLISLDLDKSADGYTLTARPIASNFDHPVDAVMVENVIYVIEYGNWFSPGGSRSVQGITLPRRAPTAHDDRPDAGALTLSVAPNPASGAVSMTYVLGQSASVRLELVDALGRVVREVRAGDQSAGSHAVSVTTDGLPSGAYLVRLIAGERQATRQLTVLR